MKVELMDGEKINLPRRFRFAIWFVNYFNFGRMAPYIFGICVGAWPRKEKENV